MDDDLRVLTWNLQGSKGVDTGRVIGVMAEYRPDVVVLQEVQRRQLARLAERAGVGLWPGERVAHAWTLKHYPYSPLVWWRAEGLAVLSRYPLSASGTVVLTPGVSTWTYRRRVMLWATITLPDGPARVLDVHLASSPDGGSERDAQAAMVAAHLDGMDDAGGGGVGGAHRAIVAGDLNGSGDTAPLAPFRALGLVDAWAAAGSGPGWTNPAGRVHQRLDYVLAGASWQITDAAMPADSAEMAHLSDHLPVAVGLRRNAGRDPA